MLNPVQDLLQRRHGGRAIQETPLSDAVVDELIEAARLTPSCFNKQPWRFLLLLSDEARAKGVAALSEGNRVWAGRAPLLIAAYAKAADDCRLPDGRAYYQFDLGMACMNLMLAATHHGFTARPMAGFDPAALRAAFGLDEADEPLAMIAVGLPGADESHLPDHYRGAAQRPRARKPAADIARRL